MLFEGEEKENFVYPEGWADGASIHPLAHVHNNAVIGDGTKVWQFASVIRSARVGQNCKIASNAIVDGSRVGNNCIISHGAFIDPGIEIGDNVFIGPHVSLCNDYWPRVEKEGWFDIGELIRGDVVVTLIESGASIGANAVILPGLIIGRDVMIAAGAVVDRDVPAYHLFKRDGSMQRINLGRVPDRRRTVNV